MVVSGGGGGGGKWREKGVEDGEIVGGWWVNCGGSVSEGGVLRVCGAGAERGRVESLRVRELMAWSTAARGSGFGGGKVDGCVRAEEEEGKEFWVWGAGGGWRDV